MSEVKNIPRLRFQEFLRDWKKSTFGESFKIVGGGTPSTSNIEFWDGEINWFTPTEIKGRHVTASKRKITTKGLQNSSAKILPVNTLLFTSRATIGEMSFATQECTTNQGFQSILPSTENDNRFIYYWSSLNKRVFLRKSTGSTFLEISKNTLEKIHIYIPSLPEQQKIADFLTAVDKRIELLEKKKTLLETYKKGVMKKIFNQEIRFKDDNGNDFPDWEELNMKEILVERKEYSTKGNGFDHISLTKEGVIPKSERYNRDFLVNDDDNKKYKVTYLNDICYNPANLKFGVICRNSYAPGIFSPIYVTFKVKNQNPVFIGHLVSRQDFINRVRKYEEGTVYERQAVKPTDFLKFSVQIPSLSEQEKISRFIYQIDTLIDILKSQIEYSKTWKKGLLQKMFV